MNYNRRGKLQYEFEFGGEWLRIESALARDTTSGYFLTFGIRRDFQVGAETVGRDRE